MDISTTTPPPCALVTGGAGFIGSHIADELIRNGYRVIIIDDLSGGLRRNIPAEALFIQGNITDAAFIANVFQKHRIDYIFHLAAYASEGLSPFVKHFNYTNNLIGSVNLINEAVKHHVKCFVFTSSVAVYGAAYTPPLNEKMSPNPQDSYGIAKYAVEMELADCRRLFGLDSIIFRPHNVYGERQNICDPYRNVIGIFMHALLTDRPLVIFGNGQQTRAFSYITDVAPIIARSIENTAFYNETFNIGADEYCSINALAEEVMSAMGRRGRIIHEAERHEACHAWCAHDKINGLIRNRSQVGLREGLKRMASWAGTVDLSETSSLPAIEIKKNLPRSWQRSGN